MGKEGLGKPAWSIIKFCAPFTWKEIGIKERLILINSLLMLISYSLLSMTATIILKDIINYLVLGEIAYYYIIAYTLCYFVSECANSIKSFSFVYVEAKIQTRLSSLVFKHVLNLGMSYHLTRQTGKVLRTIQRGSISVPQVIRTGLFYVFPIFLQLILVETYLMIVFDTVYAGIIGVSVVLYSIYTLITSEWRSSIQRNLNTSDSSFHSKATDALYNYETVKYNNAELHETQRCTQAFQDFRSGKVKMHQSLLVLHIGQEFLVSLGTSCCLLLIAYEIIQGSKQIGDLILIQGFLSLIYTPLKNMGTYYETIKQALIDSEGIIILLEQKSEIFDIKNAIILQECSGHLEYNSVTFTYNPNLPIAIRNLSFKIHPGMILGIVGTTGSGKSTVSKLLYRFYDANKGKIFVDNIDIRELTQSSLRKNIAIVPQDCCLFNDSIAYNISYGQEVNEQEIQWAARQAMVDEFVDELPNGFDTVVGEKGIRLSGGQKQRIAIARALLKNAKILCFDEATSALDTCTEKTIFDNIKDIIAKSTVIIIAHRLLSVSNAKEIIVMEAGEVIERGGHDELIEKGGRYSDLWVQQLKEKIE